MRLSTNHVLRYVAENEGISVPELVELINHSAKFDEVSANSVKRRVSELVEKEILAGDLTLNENNDDLQDRLAFILWSRHRDISWDKLDNERAASIYQESLNKGRISLQDLIDATGFSQPTVSKYISILEESNLLERVKGRPLIVRPLVNDLALFYINLYNLSLDSFSDRFSIPNLKGDIEGIEEEVAKIHIYSSAVTEGNTASEDDVERVLSDMQPKDLKPTEIIEIKNMYDAVKELRDMRDLPITINRIKLLNEELLKGLKDGIGEITSGQNIQGSDYSPPGSLLTARMAMFALENFISKYSDSVRAEILGPMSHFLFESIHPFVDGNGRTGRLLHSWILLKENLTMFIYDPRRHRKYFDRLEEANNSDISQFVDFSLQEHASYLKELKGETGESDLLKVEKPRDSEESLKSDTKKLTEF